MEKVISKLSGLGVAGLVLAGVIATSGYAGAVALTIALATLGGPFGMLGGLAVLGIIAMASSAIAEYGIDAIAKGVVNRLKESGKSSQQITDEIFSFPIISDDLKHRLKNYVW